MCYEVEQYIQQLQHDAERATHVGRGKLLLAAWAALLILYVII